MDETKEFLQIMVEKYNHAAFMQAYFISKENYPEGLYWNGYVKANIELLLQYDAVEPFRIETITDIYEGVEYSKIAVI